LIVFGEWGAADLLDLIPADSCPEIRVGLAAHSGPDSAADSRPGGVAIPAL
jgi:hypothetical protein